MNIMDRPQEHPEEYAWVKQPDSQVLIHRQRRVESGKVAVIDFNCKTVVLRLNEVEEGNHVLGEAILIQRNLENAC